MSAMDTGMLDRIEALADLAEESMWETSNRYQDDDGKECVWCGKVTEDYNVPPENRTHHDNCKLVDDLRAVRAFIRIERSLHKPQDGKVQS